MATMKTYLFFTLFIVEIAMVGCSSREDYPQPMQQAERCIANCPDSALFYLSTFKDQIKNEPKETQMHYHLLTMQAEDKKHIPHTSDSLINAIVRFYKDYDDNDKLMEAYFYLGCTYRDMNDAPQAIKAFQEAIDISENTKQYTLLGQIYGQMGMLLAYQKLYHEALEAIGQSLSYYEFQKENSKIAFATRNIARMHDALENKDSALYYYKKSYNLILKSKDRKQIESILNELGCFYYSIGQIDTAKIILSKVIEQDSDTSNGLLNLGLIYQDKNQLDSAQYYFNKTIESGNIYKQRSAYKYIANIEARKNHYSLAFSYLSKSQELADSIATITQTEAVKKIQSLYNYQNLEQKNYLLTLKNKNYRNKFYLASLIFIFVTLIVVSIALYIRKKKQTIIERERRSRMLKERQYTQSLLYIDENNQKLKELENQLKIAEKDNNILNKQLILSQKEILELSNRENITIRSKREILETTFKQSKIYIHFHRLEHKPSEEDWKNLQNAIDTTYPPFTDRLYSLYPSLSLQELRICYLIKICLPNKKVADLLNRTPSAITQTRKRLYKKIYGENGTGEELDRIILDL